MSIDSAKSRICFERGSWQIAFGESRRIFGASENDDGDTRTGNVRVVMRVSMITLSQFHRVILSRIKFHFFREVGKAAKRALKVAPLRKPVDLFQRSTLVTKS